MKAVERLERRLCVRICVNQKQNEKEKGSRLGGLGEISVHAIGL